MNRPAQSQSTLGGHLGKIFLQMARSTYSTLPRAVLEAVQNALDADADTINIVVDMSKREILVRDDGNGVTVAMFNEALDKVGDSVKEADKLGRFGLGLISPLNKADEFTFTSIRNGSRREENGQRRSPRGFYSTWTFRGADIEPQRAPVIPRVERMDLCHTSARKRRGSDCTSVTWISELHIKGFSMDRGLLDRMSFTNLQEGILSKFGKVMTMRDVTLHLQFIDIDGSSQDEVLRPSQYGGITLDPHRVETDAGPVEFHLHLVRDEGRRVKGNIHFYEWDSSDGSVYPQPITVTELLRQAQEDLQPASRKALNSGVFEGEIWVDGVKMDASRNKFVYDDNFFFLCVAIDTWWEEVGKDHWDAIQEQTDSTRWGQVGLRAMRTFEGLLGDERFGYLRDYLRQHVNIGTIGKGHAKPKRGTGAGDDEKSSTRGGRGGTDKERKPKGSSGGSSGGNAGGNQEDPEDIPGTVTDGDTPQKKRGRTRKRVKGSSVGIQLDHTELLFSTDLVEVEWDAMVVHLNVRSPLFVACDENDRWLQHLQELVLVQVVHMLPYEEQRDWLLAQFNSSAAAHVEVILGDQRRRMRKG